MTIVFIVEHTGHESSVITKCIVKYAYYNVIHYNVISVLVLVHIYIYIYTSSLTQLSHSKYGSGWSVHSFFGKIPISMLTGSILIGDFFFSRFWLE